MPILPVGATFVWLDVMWWHWVTLLALVAGLLAVDLLLHRGDREPTLRRAAAEPAIWVGCGIGFAFVVLAAWGGAAFGEYLSGYVIEKSLSIDNVFVWAVIFSSFAIPARYQRRGLFWGIFGALALRAGFIVGGAEERFHSLAHALGAILVFVGLKMVVSHWWHLPTVVSVSRKKDSSTMRPSPISSTCSAQGSWRPPGPLGLYWPNAGDPLATEDTSREPRHAAPGPSHQLKMSSRPRG